MYLDRLKEWILIGLLVCPHVLSVMSPNSGRRKKDIVLSKSMKLLKLALEDAYVITIFRDEVMVATIADISVCELVFVASSAG